MGVEPIEPEIVEPNKMKNAHSTIDFILLLVALFIDFINMWPADLDEFGIGFLLEIPGAALQEIFLLFIGTSPIKSMIETGTEFVPLVDLIPWCTMAVLYKRYHMDVFRFLF